MAVHVERQTDNTFAVYVDGDDDMEGDHDRLFSYGMIEGRRITIDQARGAALDYAQNLGKKFGGVVEHRS